MLILLLFYILHAKADSAHLILAQAYDSHHIAQFQHIFHLVDPLFGDLGDVHHTFLSGSELQERAELLDADYLALEDLSFFKVSHDNLNHVNCLVDHLFVGTADGYAAVFLNVDLHAGLLDNPVDHLALLADYIADLLRIDRNLYNLGRSFGDLSSGSCNHRIHHIVQNI